MITSPRDRPGDVRAARRRCAPWSAPPTPTSSRTPAARSAPTTRSARAAPTSTYLLEAANHAFPGAAPRPRRRAVHLRRPAPPAGQRRRQPLGHLARARHLAGRPGRADRGWRQADHHAQHGRGGRRSLDRGAARPGLRCPAAPLQHPAAAAPRRRGDGCPGLDGAAHPARAERGRAPAPAVQLRHARPQRDGAGGDAGPRRAAPPPGARAALPGGRGAVRRPPRTRPQRGGRAPPPVAAVSHRPRSGAGLCGIGGQRARDRACLGRPPARRQRAGLPGRGRALAPLASRAERRRRRSAVNGLSTARP